MSSPEPSFRGFDFDTRSVPPAEMPAVAATFSVVFATGAGAYSGDPALRRLSSKGEIAFASDRISLHGERSRLFRNKLETDLSVERTRIANVLVIARHIHFDFRGSSGWQNVTLIATDESQARAIAALLPASVNRDYASEHARRVAFFAALDQRTRYAYVTWALVAINVIVFAAMTLSGAGFVDIDPVAAIHWGSEFGPRTMGGEWWRLLTNMFIHFGIEHLALNMLAFYQVGRMTERLFGNSRYLVVYLVAGLIGSMAGLVWNPLANSAGASGAIFGVFGAVLAFMLKYRRSLPPSVIKRQQYSVLFLIISNLLSGFTSVGVDNAAHLGGLIGGFVMGWLLACPLGETRQARARRWRGELAATVMAMVMLDALAYRLGHAGEGGASIEAPELKFDTAVSELSAAETRAVDEMKAASGPGVQDPATRAIFAAKLRGDVLPEWHAMLASIEAAPLPPGSSKFALRAALLHYLADREAWCAQAAELLDSPSSARAAKLAIIGEDLKLQAAAIKELKARE